MLRNLGEYVSGRIGNVVFVRTKTKSYVRKAPNCEKTNWSENQRLYRNRMRNVAILWRSLKFDMIAEIWRVAGAQNPHQAMNGYALFVKENIPAFNIDGSLIDPLCLVVSNGKLVGSQHLNVEQSGDVPSRIIVSWVNDPNCKPPRLEDQLMAMGYKKEVFSNVENTGLYRKDLEGAFLVPDPLPETDATHLFLFWCSDDHQYSKSESFAINPNN